MSLLVLCHYLVIPFIIDVLMALTRNGMDDEILLFEPAYPCYFDQIQYTGGKVKTCELDYEDGLWTFNADKFKRALTEKTKVLILNNA